MGESTPFDVVLKACSWVAKPEELVEVQPAVCADFPRMELISVGDESFHGIPVVFSQDLEGPLCSFMLAAFDASFGRKASMGESLDRLEATLLALIVACPVRDSTAVQALLLELVRQSSSMMSGDLCRERMGRPLRQLSGMSPSEQGLIRRRVTRRLTACLSKSMTEATALCPRLRPPALFHQLLNCPLVFGHRTAAGPEMRDMRLIGAELGIEVDGDLLHDLNCAVEQSVRIHVERNGLMAGEMRERFEGGEPVAAALRPEDLERILATLQSDLRVRDLLRCGLRKDRAKSLLRMSSTSVLFEVYRQLHRQMRRFDVLSGLAARVLPIRLSTGGGTTAYGAVTSGVRWHFLCPRLQVETIDFSVVSLSFGPLLDAAVKRGQRDEQPKAIAALWGLWDGLKQEAEAEGGLATFRGSKGVAVFLSADQAQTFVRSAKEQLSVPISLHYGTEERPIVLTGVTVDIQCERGPVFGASVGEELRLWGPLFDEQASTYSEDVHSGFSILTEIGDADTELRTSDTEFEPLFQEIDGSQSPTADALGSLDSFFLPAQSGPRDSPKNFDIGLSLADIQSVLEDYGHYAGSDGMRVFGKAVDQTLTDRHAYPAGVSLLDATCAFLMDKYREGFAPRSDSVGELPSEVLLEALGPELLQEALGALGRGKGT